MTVKYGNRHRPLKLSGWIGLSVLVALSSWFFATWGYPIEDAAMIFAYSENIAHGHGVVYVPGGEHVDGASDLLYTFALAALVFVGIPVQTGAALLNGLGLGTIVLLIFLSWRRSEFDGLWPAFAAVVVFLVTTPIFFLGASGFGTLAFTALIAITAFLAARTSGGSSLAALTFLGASVAIAGMNRIEGFVLAGLIVLAQAVATKSWRLVLIPGMTALVIAVAWFIWRWSYFGYPLPNPFYKKSGIYLGSAIVAFRAVIEYATPWVPILAAGALYRRTRRLSAAYLVLIVVPWAAIWIFLSNEMNVANRFQFPLAAVLAILCASIGASVFPVLRKLVYLRFSASTAVQRRAMATLTIAVVGACLVGPMTLTAYRQWNRLAGLHSATFHQEVADAIKRSSIGTELLVTTEAGMVAWRSGLRVVDIYGLNDKRIAHEGPLSPEQIGELNPQILYSHLGKPEVLEVPADQIGSRGWEPVNISLFCFAERNGFAPAAVWTRGDLNDWWLILAKKGTPLLERLRSELSGVELLGTQATTQVSVPAVKACPDESSRAIPG